MPSQKLRPVQKSAPGLIRNVRFRDNYLCVKFNSIDLNIYDPYKTLSTMF